MARWNQHLPDGSDGSDGVSGAFAELQDDWKGREANEASNLIEGLWSCGWLWP